MSGYQKPQKYKKKMSQKILKNQFFLSGNTNNKKDSNNNLRIVQLNVEDIMKSKAEIISQIFSNVLILQETHVPIDQTNRYKQFV